MQNKPDAEDVTMGSQTPKLKKKLVIYQLIIKYSLSSIL